MPRDNFYKLAKQSLDPDLQKITEVSITSLHCKTYVYVAKKSFLNSWNVYQTKE